MALSRPLRLKSEIAKVKPQASSSELPVARVWVDSGVFHLDQSFDYLIPDNLSAAISVGVRVQVPFHGREVEAIVLSRESDSKTVSLKSITKIISIHSVATADSLALISDVAHRWAAHPYDILRSAIPPRVASVDKQTWTEQKELEFSAKSKRSYLHIPPSIDRFTFLHDVIESSKGKGSTLVIVPDSRTLARVHEILPAAVVLDSSLERAERYQNFLQVRFGQRQLVIGTRSAIFAPITDLSSLIIFDEGSESYYEARTPGWNVRDVAILRAMKSQLALSFVGYSPSSEVARLIENKWIEFVSQKSRVNVSAYPQSHGELLPSRLISEIRRAMATGPVLFLSPRKGYSQSILCSKCRNVALCECGGKLVQKGVSTSVECVICAMRNPDWKCSWCQANTPYLMGRGSERFAYEIGAAFAGQKVFQSTVDNVIEELVESRGLVVATAGVIPRASTGYALVVILEAERFFAQSDLRAHERSRELFFSTAALASSQGKVALVIASDNPIIGALSSWKPSLISQRELRERAEVNLPPYTRALTLDIAQTESQSLLRGLRKAQEDGRLPQSAQFLGPSQLKGETDRIVILAPLADGDSLISLIHEFQRRRSSSKKTLASLRIDPYSLSR